MHSVELFKYYFYSCKLRLQQAISFFKFKHMYMSICCHATFSDSVFW